MTFQDRLQQNDILPTGGYNPFGPPDMNQGNPQGVNPNIVGGLANLQATARMRGLQQLLQQQQQQNRPTGQVNPDLQFLDPRVQRQMSILGQNQQQQQASQPMNVVMGNQGNPEGAINAAEDRANSFYDPDAGLTAQQKSQKQLETRKLLLQENQGEERQALNQDKQTTNAKKEQDIHDQKQRELQTKIDESAKVMAEKQREFDKNKQDASAALDLHKAQIKNANDVANLRIAQKDKEIADAKANHQAMIDEKDKALAQAQARNEELAREAKAKADLAAGEQDTTKTKGGYTIFGHTFGGETTNTKVVKKPSSSSNNDQSANDQSNTDPNQKAIDYLKANGKPTTDANIKYLMSNIGKW